MTIDFVRKLHRNIVSYKMNQLFTDIHYYNYATQTTTQEIDLIDQRYRDFVV